MHYRDILDSHYRVYVDGSIERIKPWPNRNRSGGFLCYDDSHGYDRVSLSIAGRKTRRPVHRIVLEAFIGPCPSGYEVNHKDGNKKNNHIDNLEYVSRQDNVKHAWENSLMHPPSGDNHWTRRTPHKIGYSHRGLMKKLKDCEVAEIRRLLCCGLKGNFIAKMFKLTPSHISSIKNNKTRVGNIS